MQSNACGGGENYISNGSFSLDQIRYYQQGGGYCDCHR